MSSRRAPLHPLLARPLAPLYGFAVARRNARFNKGHGVRSGPVPVISVGNISVGGVGKSPHVRYIASVLKALGRRPAIVMRGYGPKVDGVSDEQAEHRAQAPGVPVVAHPNRYEAVARMLTTTIPKSDVAVLDDGFQHRRLRRDLDLVLIDATRSPFSDRLLPAGWLREPVSSLARASAVILTHADIPQAAALAALRADVERVTGSRPIAETRHAWGDPIPALIEGRETVKPRAYLKGRTLVVACAIGNPDALLWQTRSVGATVGEAIVFRDHAPLGDAQIAKVIDAARAINADAILCTPKDWTKFRRAPADAWPCPVLRPRVEIAFERGREEFDALIASALERPRGG